MPTNKPPNGFARIESDILIQTMWHTTCDSDTTCLLTPAMAAVWSQTAYDALQETIHLLQTPANARQILESLIQAEA